MQASRIISLLSQTEPIHINDIAECTGLDTSVVQETLDWLKDVGVACEVSSSNHVRLIRSVHPLDVPKIRKAVRLISTDMGDSIAYFEQTDSTNEYLLQKSIGHKIHAHVCISETMTAGRGRRRRKWYGGAFENIILSVAWDFGDDLRRISGLSLAVAVIVIRVLSQFTDRTIEVKWPNDILFSGKKLGGILIETQDAMTVIGIGLNCRTPEFGTEKVIQPVTSLEEVTGCIPDRNRLIIELLRELNDGLREFQIHGFSPFREMWNCHHAYRNIWMQTDGRHFQSGRATGVDRRGALLLEQRDGKIVKIHSGEVSVLSMNP